MSPSAPPRITPEQIDAAMVHVEYLRASNGRTTIAVVTLDNGAAIVGESHSLTAEGFDAPTGRLEARNNAAGKVRDVLAMRFLDARMAERNAAAFSQAADVLHYASVPSAYAGRQSALAALGECPCQQVDAPGECLCR